MPPRKSPRKAPQPLAAPGLWALSGTGGESTDLFERVLEAVQASPDARTTLPAMRLVSRRWRDMVDASVAELAPNAAVREPALSQLLRRFANLRAINADDAQRPLLRIEDATLPALLGLRRLQVLGLTFAFGPSSVAQLAPLGASLTSLSYAGDASQTRSRRGMTAGGLTDAAAGVIGRSLTALQRLNIQRCAELGEGVATFSGLTRLSTLRLYEIGKLDDASLVTALSSLTKLTALTVAMCGIGDGSMAAVSALTRLQVLDLSQNSELGDEGVARLGSLSALTSLNLSGASQVTLRGLPPLSALAHLEVASTETDDSGLLALEHLPALARLSLADCQQLSGSGLYALRCISGLVSLNLNSCLELGDDDPLAALAFLTGLTSLKLAFIEDLGDDDIANLAGLTRLQVLTLNGLAELGPQALAVLKGLKCLRTLAVPDLQLLPEEAEALKAALPALTEFQYLQAGMMQRLLDQMYADDDDE